MGPDTVYNGVIRALEKAQERLVMELEGGSGQATGFNQGRQTSVREAAEYLDPVTSIEDPALIDLRSGVGTYPLIAGSLGIDSAGIEEDPEPYMESVNTMTELKSKGLINGEVELVEGTLYDGAWNELERELEDFDVVVANRHSSAQEEVMEYLREEGPEDAVYIFPKVDDVDGFQSLSDPGYFERSI